MQTSIIALLIVVTFLAIWGFYFGFIRPIKPDFFFYFQTLNKAGFIFSAFFLVPVIIIALWLQATATNRLTKVGIVPHPSIVESSGIATGIAINGSPTWVFKVKASPEKIMAFYRKDANRRGWNLISDNPTISMLIFKRGKQKMSISIYEDWTSNKLIYMLTNEKNE